MAKITCGGFYIDDEIFDIINLDGKITLSVKPTALIGIQGPKGDRGDPFSIAKIYPSIEAMNEDYHNEAVLIDSFVLIEDGTEDGADNGKLYVKAEDKFDYVTNLSGAQGIEGPQGNDGVGVPHGGTTGQILVKASNEDFVTRWQDAPDMTQYHTKSEIDGKILPEVNDEDDGKIAVVADGKWQAGHIEFGEIIYATGSRQLNGYAVPTFTADRMQDIYNTFVSGHSVIISDVTGTKHYKVISVDASDANNITARILFEDKFIITYNKLGLVASFVSIVDGQVVSYSREYATAPNDHGYVREWTPNLQGKVWAECGVFITTVALSVGSKVPLPVTFEDGNFHVQVTVLELGNYAATAYRSGEKNSINVRVHDYYGTPKAVKICVEAKGWKSP